VKAPLWEPCEATLRPALDRVRASSDDLLLMAAGPAMPPRSCSASSVWQSARKRICSIPNQFAFAWVTDFPLLEYHEDDGRWYSMHHPFTSPLDEDVDKLESDPGAVRAKAYDLVLNGSEIGGAAFEFMTPHCRRGSPPPGHQRRGGENRFASSSRRSSMARRLTGHRARARPHHRDPRGGILNSRGDRVSKTANAIDLMAGAPSPVDAKQLRELHLRVGK